MKKFAFRFAILALTASMFIACDDSKKAVEETENSTESTAPVTEPAEQPAQPDEAVATDKLNEEISLSDVKVDESAHYQDLPEADQSAKELYESKCAMCHGVDGALGKFSATNLKTSNMLYSAKIDIITNGKGMMKGFGNDLTKEQINQVAGYLVHLKK